MHPVVHEGAVMLDARLVVGEPGGLLAGLPVEQPGQVPLLVSNRFREGRVSRWLVVVQAFTDRLPERALPQVVEPKNYRGSHQSEQEYVEDVDGAQGGVAKLDYEQEEEECRRKGEQQRQPVGEVVAQAHSGLPPSSRLSLYPSPRRVWIASGSRNPASLRRNRFTFTVRVLSSTNAVSLQSFSSSASRLTTRPFAASRASSSSPSLRLRVVLYPFASSSSLLRSQRSGPALTLSVSALVPPAYSP